MPWASQVRTLGHISSGTLGTSTRLDLGTSACWPDVVCWYACLVSQRSTFSADWIVSARSEQSRLRRRTRRRRAHTTREANCWRSWPAMVRCTSTTAVVRVMPTSRTAGFTLHITSTSRYCQWAPIFGSTICGSFGTELHHWAPTAVFGAEAVLWPTAQLCPDCHREWHRRVEDYYAAQPPQLFRREA